MESRETETAASVNNANLEKEIIVKSYAQRQKEYRKRKKIHNQLQNPKKIPKTNTQRQQQFRQNQKEKVQQNETLNLARKKENAERAKRYRDRLKLKKQFAKLDSVLSSNEDSLPTVLIENNKETDHRHDTNCEELIYSQFQIQQPINIEAQQATTNIATESINIKEELMFEDDEALIDIKEESIIDIKEEPIDPIQYPLFEDKTVIDIKKEPIIDIKKESIDTLQEKPIISNYECSTPQFIQQSDTYRDAANMVTLDGIPARYEEDTHFRNDCLQFANFVGIELQKLTDLNSLLVAKQCIKSVILDAQKGLYKSGVLPLPTNSAIKTEPE